MVLTSDPTGVDPAITQFLKMTMDEEMDSDGDGEEKDENENEEENEENEKDLMETTPIDNQKIPERASSTPSFNDSDAHWQVICKVTKIKKKQDVTKPVLQQYCRDKKMPVSGNKPDLLQRVFAHAAYDVTPIQRRGKKKVIRGDKTLKINYEQLKYFADLFIYSFESVKHELEVIILDHYREITRKQTGSVKVSAFNSYDLKFINV